MAIDVEQYFQKLKVADDELTRLGQKLESMPKTGLSAQGQKELDDVETEMKNAKMNFELIESEYQRRANELVRARERLEHVLSTSIKSIQTKYGL